MLIEVLVAAVGVLLVSLPLVASVVAFLDCARRPGWVWALVGRGQVVWLCILGFGMITVVGGVVTAVWYWTAVRPELARAEDGDIGPR